MDMVNHPPHYTKGKYEVIDVIEDWNLGFHLSNAIKYIARCKYKGQEEQDLKKAIWYIQRTLKDAPGSTSCCGGCKSSPYDQQPVDVFDTMYKSPQYTTGKAW